MELNLRPASVVKRQRLAEQRPFIILAGVCALLALAAWWLYFTQASKITETVVADIEQRSAPLKGVETKMNGARAEIKKQEQTAAPLMGAIRDRDYWATIIDDLNSRLPNEYIWVTGFGPEETTADAAADAGKKKEKETVRLLVKGIYADNPRGVDVLDEFVKNLEDSPHFEVKKDEMLRPTPDGATWGWNYQFPLVLKDPIKLPKTSTK